MSLKQLAEEWAGSCKDHFVSFDAFLPTGQGDIGEVVVFPQLSKGSVQPLLEITIPFHAQLFLLHI